MFVIKKRELSINDVWRYDIEVFPNYFLLCAVRGDETVFIEDIEDTAEWVLKEKPILAGYNNNDYDDVIIKYICEHPDSDEEDIYNLSSSIINETNQNVVRHYKYSKEPWKFSIDVFQLLNGKGSLKERMCRIGSPRILEAGLPFDKDLPRDRIQQIRSYCRNDVMGVDAHLVKYWHLVMLREKLDKEFSLGKKVHVLSEARLAQHTFMTLHEERTGQEIKIIRNKARMNVDNKKRIYYPEEIIFDHVEFKTKEFISAFNKLENSKFLGDSTGGRWHISDPSFSESMKIGTMSYKLGVGGIHSEDGPGRFNSTDEEAIVDLDVTSYYPAIIINNNLNPKQLGTGFVEDMISLRDKRVAAKRSGDKGTNEALKIVINSTFGKLNDVYSPLRSIPDALRVTVNGQWMILMLIERLEEFSKILSANTDGVTIICRKSYIETKLKSCVDWWQKKTGHELEYVFYSKLWRRDVNNYIAVTTEGKVKGKGSFSTDDKTKGDGLAITKSAIEYIVSGVEPAKTVRSCTLREFLFYQQSKNGGKLHIDDTFVGKIARWYVGKTGGGQLRRLDPPRKNAKDPTKKNWHNIPCGEDAVLAMDLTEIDERKTLHNVKIEYYIAEAHALIDSTLG